MTPPSATRAVAEQVELGARPAQALNRRWVITLYAVAVFFYWAALYLYVPTLPTYVQSRTERLATVGVVLAQYGIWQAVVRLPLGIFSDWIGRRKPFILVGFVLAAMGAVVMGASRGVTGLFIGRAITGLAASAWVPLVVVFSSLFPPKEAIRASALLTVVNSVGRGLATALTGTLNELGGYPLAFYAAAGTAAVATLALLPVREVPLARRRPSLGGIGKLITRRDVLLPALIATISQYGMWAATFGFLPILARNLGASDQLQSALTSVSVGIVLLGQLAATAFATRVGPRTLIYGSVVALGAGLLVAAIARSLPWLFLAQFCIGISQGVGYPVLMGLSIRDVEEQNRTTAMGLFQALYAIGMFGGPALSGVLADSVGIQPMFALTAAICLLPGLVCTRWLDRRSPASQG